MLSTHFIAAIVFSAGEDLLETERLNSLRTINHVFTALFSSVGEHFSISESFM